MLEATELRVLLKQLGLIAGEGPDDLTPLPSRSGSPIQESGILVPCAASSSPSKLADVPKPLLSAAANQPDESGSGPHSLTSGSLSSNPPTTPEVDAPRPVTANFLESGHSQSDFLFGHIENMDPQNPLIKPDMIPSSSKAAGHLDSIAQDTLPLLPSSQPGHSGEAHKRPRVPRLFDSPKNESKRRRVMKNKQSNYTEEAIQDVACFKFDPSLHLTKCCACRHKQPGDSCRFTGLRKLKWEKKSFMTSFQGATESQQNFDFPSTWNTDINPYIPYLKQAISRALLPTLELELEHLNKTNLICRPWEESVRATCDSCLTSLFSCTWLCSQCGREFCSDCLIRLRGFRPEPQPGPQEQNRPEKPTRQPSSRRVRHTGDHGLLLKCNIQSDHSADDFLPISRFHREQLQTIVNEMLSLLPAPTNLASQGAERPIDPGTLKSRLEAASINDPGPTPLNCEGEVPSHPTIKIPSEQLNHDGFVSLWLKHTPIVVDDVVPPEMNRWKPQYIIENYGEQQCPIENCQTGEQKLATVRDFFEMFGKNVSTPWKLKDWPTTDDFKNVFPNHFDDFQGMVPASAYTRRDGALNLISHFPKNTIAPDVGPKMYNALATEERPGTLGTTKLHMDMADAVNIMVHAESCGDEEGYAIWDIYRAEDSEYIREYLRKFPNPLVVKVLPDGSSPDQDPIHTQSFYLDPIKRKELYQEFGIYSHRIYQRPGQAVFIPAGCAHQVINMADCIKVAVDFVSCENIHHCMKLTSEFRNQNQVKCWKEDILQLKTMMWYTWLSCSRFDLVA